MAKIEKEGDTFFQSLNWVELVFEPAKEGRFKEAFSAADSLIDSTIELLLRDIYSCFKCQDLINEIHHLRSRVNFDGMVLLEILKSKTIIDDELLKKVRQFKRARDLVLHENSAHYALISPTESKEIEKTEEYDKFAEDKANFWLKEAEKIESELTDKFREIREKGRDYYFSPAFYNDHPRSKINERKYPKPPSKK